MKRLFLSGMVAISIAAIFYLYRTKDAEMAQSVSVITNDEQPKEKEVMPPSEAKSAVSPPALSEKTLRSLRVLNEVLASKNDNDPRLDQEFRKLSPELKLALRAKYENLSLEDRNGRGTIVFLLGREISTPEDLEFLHAVLSEPPCLSLSDCAKETVESRGGDEDSSLGVSTTLAYPQLVGLVSLDKLLSKAGANGLEREMRDAAWKIVDAAKGSPIAAVAKRAAEIERKLRASRS